VSGGEPGADGHGRARDTAGVIAPPPLIFLGAVGLGLALDRLAGLPALGLPMALRWALGVALLSLGLALGLSAIRAFRAAGTPPEPWEPTTAFVARGPYRFTRNPMYLAMALGTLALAAAFDSPGVLLLVPPLLALVQWGVIAREERYMARRFGQPYLDYRARVRRWL
jgi:protein-S-isoprenylcysteine O-methyltransferase Ste14